MGRIFFRADGNSKIGLGHVIRSLALAEMLSEQFECHFLIRDPLLSLKNQITQVCRSIIYLDDTDEDIEEAKIITENHFKEEDIVVLDGYHFVTEYQKIIKAKGCTLVCIDDINAYHFVADVIINHAGGMITAQYSVEPYTQFIFGLKYALLREPFRKAAQEKRGGHSTDRLFVCLGGADPNNDTIDVLHRCLTNKRFKKIYVIVGAAYQYWEHLDALFRSRPEEIEILHDLSAQRMVKYMKKCGTAVTTPSSISYEYLSVRGILYLVTTAENQKKMYDYFILNSLAYKFDEFPVKNTQKNEDLYENQKSKFDGNQKARFIELFKTLI